jgi:hypothetical protein
LRLDDDALIFVYCGFSERPMTDLRQMFAGLNGQTLTGRELYEKVKVIHRENWKQLTVEVRTEDLYDYLQIAEWAQRREDRSFEVTIR